MFLFLGWRFSALALKFWQKNDSTIPTRCELPLQTALASAFLLPPLFLSFLLVHMHFAINNMLRLQAKIFSHFILSRLLTRIDFLISILAD